MNLILTLLDANMWHPATSRKGGRTTGERGCNCSRWHVHGPKQKRLNAASGVGQETQGGIGGAHRNCPGSALSANAIGLIGCGFEMVEERVVASSGGRIDASTARTMA